MRREQSPGTSPGFASERLFQELVKFPLNEGPGKRDQLEEALRGPGGDQAQGIFRWLLGWIPNGPTQYLACRHLPQD